MLPDCGLGGRRIVVWFPDEARDCCPIHSIQKGSGAHQVSHSIGPETLYPGLKQQWREAKQLHLVLSLRMSGAISVLPLTPSLSTQNLPLLYLSDAAKNNMRQVQEPTCFRFICYIIGYYRRTYCNSATYDRALFNWSQLLGRTQTQTTHKYVALYNNIYKSSVCTLRTGHTTKCLHKNFRHKIHWISDYWRGGQ